MSKEHVTPGDGNIFADLDLDEPEELLMKARLVQRIGRIIERHGWTQVQAAERLGISQPKVSALLRGRLDGFSTERLLRFLTALDQDVEIAVRQTSAARPRAGLHVSFDDDSLPIAAAAGERRVAP